MLVWNDAILLCVVAVAYGHTKLSQFVSNVVGHAEALGEKSLLPGTEQVLRLAAQPALSVNPRHEKMFIGVGLPSPWITEFLKPSTQLGEWCLVGRGAQHLVGVLIGQN